MRIKRIKLSGMGVSSGEYDLHPNCTVITGPNGSGKTTIANAVRFALTKETTLGKQLAKTAALITPGHNGIASSITLDDGKTVTRSLFEDPIEGGCTGRVNWAGGHKGAPAEAKLSVMLEDCVFGIDLAGWRELSAAKRVELLARAFQIEGDEDALVASFMSELQGAGVNTLGIITGPCEPEESREWRNSVRKNKQRSEKALQVISRRVASKPAPDRPYIRVQEDAVGAREDLASANTALLEYRARCGSVEALRDNLRVLASKLPPLEDDTELLATRAKEAEQAVAEACKAKDAAEEASKASDDLYDADVENLEAKSTAMDVLRRKQSDTHATLSQARFDLEAAEACVLGAMSDPWAKVLEHARFLYSSVEVCDQEEGEAISQIMLIASENQPDHTALKGAEIAIHETVADLEHLQAENESAIKQAESDLVSARACEKATGLAAGRDAAFLSEVQSRLDNAVRDHAHISEELNKAEHDRDACMASITLAEAELERVQGVVGSVSDVSILEESASKAKANLEELSGLEEDWREFRALEGESETIEKEVAELESELLIADAWLSAVQKVAAAGLKEKLKPLTETLESFVGRKVDVDLSVSPPRFDITLDGHSAISGGERLLLEAATATAVYAELSPQLPLVIIEAAEADRDTLCNMIVALANQEDIQAVILTHLNPMIEENIDKFAMIRCEKTGEIIDASYEVI